MSDRPQKLTAWCCWALLVAASLILGCAETERTSSLADDHHHSHEQATYADARERLLTLSGKLANIDTISRQGYAEHLVEEFIEVAEQIPKLAADTDLPEEDWNHVDRASADLLRLLDTVDLSLDDWRAEARKLQPAMQDAVASLPQEEKLFPFETTAETGN